MDFSNKVVIFTGASKGIGNGVASLYAEKGAKVAIADLDEAAGRLRQGIANLITIDPDFHCSCDSDR